MPSMSSRSWSRSARRIRDKRGVDYTEEQVRELANVRLEKFLDPKNLRSDLLEQFRRSRPPKTRRCRRSATYEFARTDALRHPSGPAAHHPAAGSIPILKLFFNPNAIVNVLHKQADLNRHFVRTTTQARVDRAAWNSLYYEVLHNLVLETTRSGIELKNLKMRVEALSSRLDFSERRVRALEGVVQYRPEAVAPRERRIDAADSGGWQRRTGGSARRGRLAAAAVGGGQDADGRRRRRRRRGRRGPGFGGVAGAPAIGGAPGGDQGDTGADDGDGGEEGDDTPETRQEPAAAADTPAAAPPPDADPLAS